MLKVIAAKYQSSKKLIHYFFLTYLDKVISFALPLSVLFLIKDRSLYATVEIAFSYATLVMVCIELGVSNYLFYGYKKAEDQETFVRKAQVYFRFLILVYSLLSLLLTFCIHHLDSRITLLFLLIVSRSLFTLYLSFFANIYRLMEKPSRVYVPSMIINISSLILLLCAHLFSWPHTLIYFAIPAFILMFVACIRFVSSDMREFRMAGFTEFIRSSLSFSWPIILNVLAMSYVNNYAKIYAYDYLSEQETVQISYVMRIGLIIQLTHSAFSSFYSKSLFMQQDNRFNYKIFGQYQLVLLLSSLMVVGVVLGTNWLFGDRITISLDLSSFLLLIYILLWCYIGYLEIYFGVMNANRRVLYYSVISSLLYTILLLLMKNIDLLKLSLCMVIAGVVNLALVIGGLYQLRVFTKR